MSLNVDPKYCGELAPIQAGLGESAFTITLAPSLIFHTRMNNCGERFVCIAHFLRAPYRDPIDAPNR